MNRKKDHYKTMLLIVLMFIGINYSLYIFYIQPSYVRLEEVKADFFAGQENVDYQQYLESAIDEIQVDIDMLQSAESEYESLVANNIDTIQIAYDIYRFASRHDVEAEEVTYSMVEIDQYLYKVSNTEEAAGDISDEGVEVSLEPVVEEVLPLYVTVPITVVFVVPEASLQPFLADLANMTEEKLFFVGGEIAAEQRSESIAEGETEGMADTVKLTLNYESYMDTANLSEADAFGYEFYEVNESHEDLSDMFEAIKVNEDQ